MNSVGSSIHACSLGILFSLVLNAHATAAKPNIILFLADDFGYGDLSVYGHPSQEWGPVDQMATEGVRFTNWYAPDMSCTPSRTAILTGRLPLRSGMVAGKSKATFRLLLPWTSVGLPHSEVTIAEMLKTQGYTTGMVGKWHLGINMYNRTDGGNLPNHHGFDHVGHFLPFSLISLCDESKRHKRVPHPKRTSCMLYYNRTLVQQPIDLSTLTEKMVNDAKHFIYKNSAGPFFFFFSLPQTHTPMFNNKKFENSSRRGHYGSNVNEMSWAVGEVLRTLRDLDIDNNTLSIFTSDHGPALNFCNEGGSAGLLKGGKQYYWEGGVRVPFIARWPGTLKPSVKHNMGSLMDLLPTFADIAGASLHSEKILDGKSQVKVLAHDKDETARETIFFYWDHTLMAVRHKSFKIYFRSCSEKELQPNYYKTFCKNGDPDVIERSIGCDEMNSKLETPLIFNVDVDPAEQFPLSGETYDSLLKVVGSLVQKHADSFTSIPQDNLFSPAYAHRSLNPCCNPPYCFCNYTPKR